jgi:hypothetical protein
MSHPGAARAVSDHLTALEAARKKEMFCEDWGPIFRYEASRDVIICRRCDREFQTIDGARAHGTWILEQPVWTECT